MKARAEGDFVHCADSTNAAPVATLLHAFSPSHSIGCGTFLICRFLGGVAETFARLIDHRRLLPRLRETKRHSQERARSPRLSDRGSSSHGRQIHQTAARYFGEPRLRERL